jgi:hypothetical protein
VPTLSRASAWVWASSLVFCAGIAGAQPKPAPGTTSDRPVEQQSGGRNAFIAPVVDIRIQGEGLMLPKEAEPAQDAPKPAAEPVRTAPPADGKSAPPATAK